MDSKVQRVMLFFDECFEVKWSLLFVIVVKKYRFFEIIGFVFNVYIILCILFIVLKILVKGLIKILILQVYCLIILWIGMYFEFLYFMFDL